MCGACKGAGILAPEKVPKMNALRHTVNKLGGLLKPGDVSPSMHDSVWVISNRCKRCRGTGSIVCAACDGTGKRGPP